MASMLGVYLNCIWELILTKYQNGICVWSVSELYLRENLNEYQNGIYLWIVPELFLEEDLVYLDCFHGESSLIVFEKKSTGEH